MARIALDLRTLATARPQVADEDVDHVHEGRLRLRRLLRVVVEDVTATIRAIDSPPRSESRGGRSTAWIDRLIRALDAPPIGSLATAGRGAPEPRSPAAILWKRIGTVTVEALLAWETAPVQTRPQGAAIRAVVADVVALARAAAAADTQIAEVLARARTDDVTGPRTAARTFRAAAARLERVTGGAAAWLAARADVDEARAEVGVWHPRRLVRVEAPADLSRAADRLTALVDGEAHVSPDRLVQITTVHRWSVQTVAELLAGAGRDRSHLGLRALADRLRRHAAELDVGDMRGLRVASLQADDPSRLALRQAREIAAELERMLSSSPAPRLGDRDLAGLLALTLRMPAVTRALAGRASREASAGGWIVHVGESSPRAAGGRSRLARRLRAVPGSRAYSAVEQQVAAWARSDTRPPDTIPVVRLLRRAAADAHALAGVVPRARTVPDQSPRRLFSPPVSPLSRATSPTLSAPSP